VLFSVVVLSLGEAFEQAAGVGGGAQQVRGFLEGFVVGAGDEDGVASAGVNLDRGAVVVDLLYEREQVLACFAGGFGAMSVGKGCSSAPGSVRRKRSRAPEAARSEVSR
jgi:hypothetical protein